jgi:hypothetical protein
VPDKAVDGAAVERPAVPESVVERSPFGRQVDTELRGLARAGSVASAVGAVDPRSRARMALQLQRTCGNAALGRVLARSPGDPFDTSGDWLSAEQQRKAELERAETGAGRQLTLNRLAAMSDRDAFDQAPGIAFRAQDRGDVELATAATARMLRAWQASSQHPVSFDGVLGAEDAVDTLLGRADRALSAGQFDLGGNLLSISMVQLVRAANAAVARRPAQQGPAFEMLGPILMQMQRDQEREILSRIKRAGELFERHGAAVAKRADATEMARFEAMANALRAAERRAGPAIAADLGEIDVPQAAKQAGGGSRVAVTPPPRPKATSAKPASRAAESIVNAVQPDLEGALVYYATSPMKYGNIRSPRYGVAGTMAGAHRLAGELFGRRSAVIVEDLNAKDPQGQRQIRYLVLALTLRLNPPNPALGEGGAMVAYKDIQMLAGPASKRYIFLGIASPPWLFFSPGLLSYIQNVRASEKAERDAGFEPPALDPKARRDAIFGPIDKLIADGETQEAANQLTFVGAEGFALVDSAAKISYITTLLNAFTFETHEYTVVEVFRSVHGKDELRTILYGLNRAGVVRKLHTDMETAFPALLMTVGQAVNATALTPQQTKALLGQLKILSPIPGIEVRGDGSIALTNAPAELVTAIEQLLATLAGMVTGIVDIILDPETFAKGIYQLGYFCVMADLASKGHADAIRYVSGVIDGIGRQVGAAIRGLAAIQENLPEGVEFVRDIQRAVEWRIVWEVIGLFVGVGEAAAFIDAVKGGRATAAMVDLAKTLSGARKLRAAEDLGEGAKALEGGSKAMREGRELGAAGKVGDEVAVTRDLENGARLRYRADGRRMLCINPCAELGHLSLSDDIIDAAVAKLPSGQTRELVETLAAFKKTEEIPVIESLVTKLSRGGDEAKDATDLLERISDLRKIEGYEFKLEELEAAHARGDAILAHGPLQTPEFLEDMDWGGKVGQWGLEDGQLTFPGRSRSLAEHKLPEKFQTLDFVIIENEKGGPAKLVVGHYHSGLSGGRPFVYAAGEMKFSSTGELLKMTRLSGHYRPAVENLERAREFLRSRGLLSPRGVELVQAIP